MKGKINAILVFLLLPGALTAAPEMAVLPFQVSGQIDLPFTEQDLPDLFAEATHFIFDSTRDFRVQDPAETRRALKKIGFQPDHVLGPAVLRSICRETRASRIFTGEARFLAEGRGQPFCNRAFLSDRERSRALQCIRPGQPVAAGTAGSDS
jgi:hypothetical protein